MDVIVLNCGMESIIDWISSSTKNKILAIYFMGGLFGLRMRYESGLNTRN